jgi:5-methylcytosine-specific restriction endonuclease McrA
LSKRPYSTQRWLRLRELKLQYHPLCQACLKLGKIRPATVVDHNVPIRAGGAPYPALDELTSLCESCHNRKTRGEQLGKELPRVRGCDEHGYPLDPAHPWNRKK